MSRPLRLLQIAPYPLLPAVAGGKIRIVQLARALSRLGVDVTIVAPFHVTQRRALAAREPFTLRQVPYAPFLLPFLLVDRPFPYGMLASYHPGYGALLPVSPAQFDVCQIEHPGFVDLARAVPASTPIVYSSQNVEFDYVSAECRSGWIRRLAGDRVRGLEEQLVRRASQVFACTEADGIRFQDLYGLAADRVTIVPNGIDLGAVDAARARARPEPIRLTRRAIFSGSDIATNRDAIRAILTRVAPRLEREVEFVIVGRCARRFRGSGGPNVWFDSEGDVPKYAGPAAVGLNPVEGGSGSNLKLLHYLACDLPVLSTPFGLRGYEDLAPWVVTAQLEGFTEALRGDLPTCHGLRASLAPYEWRVIARRAVRVYESLVRRHEVAVPA